jgi:hypothetical protein
MPRDLILFLHGISGSALRDRQTGKLSWGRPSYLLGWRDYYLHRLPYKPGEPDRATNGPVLDWIWFSHLFKLRVAFYENLFRVLRERAGRTQGDLDAPSADADFYVWSYDWRQSVGDVAQRLDDVVERLLEFYQNPDLKITLISHSTAGLAAMHWFAFGGAELRETDTTPTPNFPRRRNLGRMIQIGVPHRGTLKVMFDLTWGIRVLPAGRRYHPDFLFSMPPMYELLPFDSAGCFADAAGAPLDIDMHRLDDWYRWRLGPFTRFPHLLEDEDARAFLSRTLPRAKRLQRALIQPWPDEMRDHVHIVSSSAFATLRRMRASERGLDTAAAMAACKTGEWENATDRSDVAAGDWFASAESLMALPHRPEHLHTARCAHRYLFTDADAQRGLVEALKGD